MVTFVKLRSSVLLIVPLIAAASTACTTVTTIEVTDAGVKAPKEPADSPRERPDAGELPEMATGPATDMGSTADAGAALDAGPKLEATSFDVSSGWPMNGTCATGCAKLGFTCTSSCPGPKSPAVAGSARWSEDAFIQGETVEMTTCTDRVPVPDFKPASHRLQDVSCCCLAPPIQYIHAGAKELKSCDDVCAAKGLTCSDTRGPQGKGAVFEFSGNCERPEPCNSVPGPTGTCVNKSRPLTDVTCTCL